MAITADAESMAHQTKYKYVAKDADGKTVRGVVEALSSRGARNAVMERALEPVKIKEKTGLNVQFGGAKVKPVALMHLSRQLAAFIRAGIPILDALQSLADGTDSTHLKKVLYDIADALKSGESVADSFAEHPKVFPSFYLGVVGAAEHTGNLDSALDDLANYLDRDIEARRKLKSALTYPAVILLMSLVTVLVLTIFVLPRFEDFFASLGADLPLPTRILLAATGFLTTWWPVIFGAFGVVAFLSFIFVKTPKGKALWDALLLKIPVLGDTLRYAIVERFCRTFGSMVEAAVPLPDALLVASEGTNNTVFKRKISTARDEMIQGAGIAKPILDTGLFPIAMTQMVRAGEDTGTLEIQLMTAADYFEKELDYKIKRFTALFEPAVIVAAGLIVGFVAIALVSAMYGIFRQVGGM